ncbi:hypothetical protein A3860_09160 [Niastella vici]|uniref:Lipoprotein n=1 Tax=Niastella vici TaxID=1703345 RepID=A0A1V9FHE4_9BACT|nr:hypothetical protein [Niastella vici]OQP57785.1 hypothetical protein A3860_09160 [Niastella vici]
MKKLQPLLLVCFSVLFACKKQVGIETADTAKAGVKLSGSMYFDKKSNPDVKIPVKFASLWEAIDFMTKNYTRVNKDGTPYGTTQKATVSTANGRTANTLDNDQIPSPVASINSASTTGIIWGQDLPATYLWETDWSLRTYSGTVFSDVCPYWFSSPYGAFYIGPYGGSKIVKPAFSAVYAERGISCSISFSVKFAPRANGAYPKMMYAEGNQPPAFSVSGATGIKFGQSADIQINEFGIGTVHGQMEEQRVYIVTNSGARMFKAASSQNYPVGAVLPNGDVIKYSIDAQTSYSVTFQFQFYDNDILHEDYYDGSCNFPQQEVPFLVYSDGGSYFLGIPSN